MCGEIVEEESSSVQSVEEDELENDGMPEVDDDVIDEEND